jgi:hypothetical protein
LYRETYRGFNVRHVHHLRQRDHGVTLSYSFVRLALLFSIVKNGTPMWDGTERSLSQR